MMGLYSSQSRVHLYLMYSYYLSKLHCAFELASGLAPDSTSPFYLPIVYDYGYADFVGISWPYSGFWYEVLCE